MKMNERASKLSHHSLAMVLSLLVLVGCGSNNGISKGDDQIAPSQPVNLSASNITATSITLHWDASADNVLTTGYHLYRDEMEIATTPNTNYTDQGLLADTVYHYQVIAYDAAGNESNESAGLTVSTVPAMAGNCGIRTGDVVAIPFRFVTPRNVGKYVTLGATSTLVEYNVHSHLDAPDINWSRRYKPYKYGNGGGAVTTWRLDAAPANGTLYEGTTALASNDTITDPDDLFYVPDNNFIGNDTFTYCAADATGLSNVATVSLEVANPTAYPMPLGVVNPNFGIDESPPADPAAWPEAEVAGYYYIDSDDPACSDTNNYGTPDLPRCTIPASGASIAAGSKMVLAASTQPYNLRDSSWQQVEFNGVNGATSWLVGDEKGPGKPRITPHPNRIGLGTQFRVTGSYLRISGVVFDGVTPRHMNSDATNVVLRHSEVKNNPSTGGGGTSVGIGGRDVLIFNVYAHDNGIVEANGLSEERDIHAFVGTKQSAYWLLDNRCDENAGDCVQLTNNNTTSDVYVGRLVAHSEGENCVDIKDFNRVVVSESDCWDLRRVAYGNSGGNAQNFYVNDEGVQQNFVYFLNNRSWDTAGANFAASNIGGRVYFIGNLSFASPAGDGLNFGGGGGSRYAYFNTFSDSQIGMMLYGSGSSLDRFIAANVINGASLFETRIQADTSVINTLDYNFYTDTMGDFANGGSTPKVHSGLAAFQTALGLSQNSAEGIDAAFVDETVGDYRLKAESSLIDSVPSSFMSRQPLSADLTNDLGISLQDLAGSLRPQDVNYDAGAYSY
jgi:chitodextrinase